MSELPILYNFRRCPYAMRARMMMHYSNIESIVREVDLRNKPSHMIEISPKATVPLLLLKNGEIIDESIDIMRYALSISDPEGFLENEQKSAISANDLIKSNDKEFCSLLRKYKYFEKHPESSQQEYRNQIENKFLRIYEQYLENSSFLCGKKTIADYALIPFIRQFSLVDEEWFLSSGYSNIIKWLNNFINSNKFEEIIMRKANPWVSGDKEILFLHNS